MMSGLHKHPLVEEEPPLEWHRPLNLLAHNRPFDAVGQTASISSEPAEVHFHFLPGQPLQQQVVQLRNNSKAHTRVIVVPPASGNFKVVGVRGGGYLAPGLSQHLLVEFTGQQLQRYDDTILVHTEGGGLAIPLHASPASSCPQLPRHLDLGSVPLGQTLTHKLQLSCAAAVSFSFSITVLQHNRHFTVQPLSGTVPAQSSTAVTISFTPTRYSTERLELSVLLAEDGAQPMRMRVAASCKPGLVQQQALSASKEQEAQPVTAAAADGAQGSSRQPLDQKARSPKAARSSPIAAHSSPRQRAAGSPCQLPEAIKAQHITQHDVNMLMNQRPGKLMTKDIKAAIVARKQELACEQADLQAALETGVASGIDPLDQPDVQPDVKEALFQLQLSQVEAGARHGAGPVSGKECARVGRTPPTAEEVVAMTAARAAVLAEEEAHRQQAALHRLQLEMSATGAVHVLPDQPSSSQQAGPSSSWACSSPGLESFQPQWLLLSESNDWRKRVQVAQRFVQAVRVVMYRNRAQARLKKLRALAAHLGGRKDGLAGQVLQDVVVEGSVVQRPGLPPTQLMVPGKVRPTELPVLCPQAYVLHEEVSKGLYGDFSMLQPQPYKAEFEYVQLGYSAEEVPALLPYVPQCQQQPLLPGAPEDLPGGLQVGLLPQSVSALVSMEGMPDGLLSNPYTSSSHDSNLQFGAPAPAWGLVPEMQRPRAFSHADSGVGPQGLASVKALAAASLQPAQG